MIEKRLKKEMLLIEKEKDIMVKLVDKNYRHMKATIKGSEDSVYEGGLFVIDIQIVDNYPYKPPKMKFDTKIWHPNISSQTGAICLDILKDEWSPALSIRTALRSLQALMTSPEPGKLTRRPTGRDGCWRIQDQLRTLQKERKRVDTEVR